MNRRSMFKAAIGACVAILFPRRADAALEHQKGHWARLVEFVMSGAKHPLEGDETKRIEGLLESQFAKNTTRKLAAKLAETARKEARHAHAKLDVATYLVSVLRHWEHPITRIYVKSGGGARSVHIHDAVALSMNDSELAYELMQALLSMIHKNETLTVTAKGCFVAGDINTLGGLSKT